jgi:hypothetical protein
MFPANRFANACIHFSQSYDIPLLANKPSATTGGRSGSLLFSDRDSIGFIQGKLKSIAAADGEFRPQLFG